MINNPSTQLPQISVDNCLNYFTENNIDLLLCQSLSRLSEIEAAIRKGPETDWWMFGATLATAVIAAMIAIFIAITTYKVQRKQNRKEEEMNALLSLIDELEKEIALYGNLLDMSASPAPLPKQSSRFHVIAYGFDLNLKHGLSTIEAMRALANFSEERQRILLSKSSLQITDDTPFSEKEKSRLETLATKYYQELEELRLGCLEAILKIQKQTKEYKRAKKKITSAFSQ
ncbi:MAG: hypothetical protein HWE34_13885 [Methylocystaceae bacterium]|nr:hypothetical protein [Methylocystaceae bacterium]